MTTLHDLILKSQSLPDPDNSLREEFLEKLRLRQYGARQLFDLFSVKDSEGLSVFLSAAKNLDYKLLKKFFRALKFGKNLSVTQKEIINFINQCADKTGESALWLILPDNEESANDKKKVKKKMRNTIDRKWG